MNSLRAGFLIACLACVGLAQVTIKFTPESKAVPAAVVANARSLTRYQADFCNVGTQPAVLTPQAISLAAPTIPLIDSYDAAMVLNGDVSKTFWSQLEHYASIGSQVAALALAVKGGSSAWSTGLAVGGSLLPGVVTIARGQVPSASALLVQLQYPLTLPPGACNTDHFFASRSRKGAAAPVVVTIAAH